MPIWRKLSHENILSFRGVNMTLFQLALVYDWGQNGNISQYMASHPGASRPALVRKSPITRETTTNILTLVASRTIAAWCREGVAVPSFG